jgi:hypothetical protein
MGTWQDVSMQGMITMEKLSSGRRRLSPFTREQRPGIREVRDWVVFLQRLKCSSSSVTCKCSLRRWKLFCSICTDIWIWFRASYLPYIAHRHDHTCPLPEYLSLRPSVWVKKKGGSFGAVRKILLKPQRTLDCFHVWLLAPALSVHTCEEKLGFMDLFLSNLLISRAGKYNNILGVFLVALQ